MNKILKTILCILLIMLAFSCKNQFNELSNNSTSGYGTIYFVDSSRTVLETVEKDDFTKIILYAKKSDSLEAQKISEWKSYSDFVQSTVSVAIGTYDFYLEAFAGNVKFESDEITAEIKENQKTNVNFVLHLVDKGEGNGNVKITYLFGEYNVATADFKLFKVEYVDDDKGGKIRTLKNVDVSSGDNDENPVGDWNIWGDSEDPEQENYCIFEKSIPAGQYELTARFETESEDYVAEYSTSVSVSEGITSSKEITIENFNPYYVIRYTYPDDAEFITYDYPLIYSMYDEIKKEQLPILTRDNYEFQGWYLDENFAEPFEGITRYGNVRGNLNLFPKWKLTTSQYLLFNQTSELTANFCTMQLSMTDILNSPLDRPQISNWNLIEYTIGGPDFFYYLIIEDGGYVLKNSNEEDFNIPAFVGEETDDEVVLIDDIFYDNESDTLYGLGTKYEILNDGSGEPQDLVLCSYNKIKTCFTLTSTFNADYHFDGTTEHNTFVVRNNKTYILYKEINSNTVYLDIFDQNGGEPTKIIDISKSFDENLLTAKLSINDMTVIDEKIYILWSYYFISEVPERYNSNAPSKIESFGGVLCVNENGNVENLFTTPSEEKEIDIPGYSDIALVNYYGPSSESDTNCLYGPTKFIAIKPKKLVFADEGIFVYNDADDYPKYKNINRVVEIDLENNRAVKDVSVSFTKDMESEIVVYSSYSSIVNDATVSEE